MTLLWEREVGEGYSGPVVAGDRIWIHTRRADSEFVSSLLVSSGEVVWSQSYDSPFRQDESASMHGRGPYSTPAVAGGRLFTYGITGVLSAWDAGSGRLLWRKESAREFQPGHPYFGAAASPLVWGELCFVHLGGHYRTNPEAPGVGAIVALRVSDGQEVWRSGGDGPAVGSSPVICDVERQPQLVFETQKHIAGFDPATGKELWRIPYKVYLDNTIVTPLCTGGRLLTSDYEIGFKAWRIERRGGAWTVRTLWSHRQVSLFTSSPVFAGGLVAGFSHFRKGQLFMLDPNDGEVLWRGEPRGGEHATLISRGSELMVFLEDGSLLVGEVSRGLLRPIQRYRLGRQAAWTHAAVAGDRIICKAGTSLAVYR